uniref:Uncharacterized protein n=1 Tax=Poecilia mexicana TaxID=48701 RepID=A0A3B3XHS1_9TELE
MKNNVSSASSLVLLGPGTDPLLFCWSFCLFLQNFCSNSTVLRTQTACHSCSISMFVPCPTGFRRISLIGSGLDRYQIQTSSLQLAVSGCSFQCFQQVEVKSCCPGYWGPDCMGQYCSALTVFCRKLGPDRTWTKDQSRFWSRFWFRP